MSMTGYGRESFHYGETTITVEIKTVNSRYLDVSIKIPRMLQYLEVSMKQLIQKHFARGRVEIYVTLTGVPLESRSLTIDWNLLDQFVEQMKLATKRYQLKTDISLQMLTSIEELISVERADDEIDIQEPLFVCLQNVIAEVKSSRQSEGEYLIADILQHLAEIKNIVTMIEQQKEVVYEQYLHRITERINSFIGESIEVDSSAIVHEVALFAEKGDITEELTRLNSHLSHFEDVIANDHVIGRKLDFIVQEMLRETNTIGAKSIDAELSKLIVTIKSNIEKIKEQIQNIE